MAPDLRTLERERNGVANEAELIPRRLSPRMYRDEDVAQTDRCIRAGGFKHCMTHKSTFPAGEAICDFVYACDHGVEG
jgi:hypothetical protein